ncbi:EP300-interacting inhibitor of differentiation 3 [Hyposmocoma kahamanoa]|uniref:EP300-interacting inhibitor of differentiation 3 n=1 Tax=Hyposmocoma kahamanoa TaxID=1477025 RepID=UPI000E6D5D3B|nr:EP300-interacting inhibitor of differentiation 3 [Hyposmocoma kahamanoa]
MSTINSTQRSRISTGSYDRKLRYRALLEKLTAEDECNNLDVMQQTATETLQKVQELLAEGDVEERVKHPGEGYLDSRVLRATSEIAVRCSESVSANTNAYDKHELAQHIRENPSYWDFMFPLEVPTVAYLHGTFAPTPPEQRARLPRKRVERQQAAALKAPETVDKLERSEEGSEMVSRVNRFLNKTFKERGGTPLSYFHVVIDPDSFSRTIENIYHVSFLVRDGMVAVKLDDNYGLPFITPLAKQKERRDIDDENQFIVSIDMQLWQDLKEAFDIQKPMMGLKR